MYRPLSFINSFVYDHSTKIRVLIDLFLLFVHDHSTKLYGPLSFILSLFCARPFDQKLGSSLIYLFYLYTTIRPKIRVLIDLVFYLHTTSRPNYLLFHLLFLQRTTILPKIRVHIDLFFYLHTTIWPKIRVFIDIFLSFAHDHSTKIYDLLSFIYSFFVHDHSTKK